jgi:tRNA A-37 threonylcarbamoyl transferase component Bud32
MEVNLVSPGDTPMRPPAGSESATLPALNSPADAAPQVLSIPGYELLAELGRGGMGVVYQARQTKLHRLVALKMILAGGHAGAADLARFQTEAEAIARLQHPNIVQVHEVGEHEGKPFLALEFCSGGSLEKKLNGTPLPPREAAQLIETLARAMDAAHRQHVVHRDLKPANVLLTGDGTPKITDFGLAKQLDAASHTQTNAILGTPSYMAPEQAGARSKDIGPATDVYALGAILYELLTGRPPFKAATPLDTVLQVVSDEPVPPTQLQSKTPRDLETICLKCLHKEPGKRYATAAALADDLRRFQAGEPIQARPVGRVERGAKWVRRNPALALMAITLMLTLIAATAISTGFGIQSRQNEADAVAKGHDLATANANLKRTADDLKSAQDDLQTALARSLLRPLAPDDKGINAAELESLWDLARQRDDRLRFRFVEEALRTPTTSRQLRARAALALHASVGLDSDQRERVEELLRARLDDPALGEEQKVDVALAASAWEDISIAGSRRTARELAQALTTAKGSPAPLAHGLATAAARLEPTDAIALLTQVLKATDDPLAVSFLAQGLAQVAGRLNSKDAAAATAPAAAALTRAIRATKDQSYYGLSLNNGQIQPLKQSLAEVAVHLGPEDAALVVAGLSQAMTATTHPTTLSTLATLLSVVAARLDPKARTTATSHAFAALTRAIQDMKTNKDPLTSYSLHELGDALAALATCLESEDAVVAIAPATAAITQAIQSNANDSLWGPIWAIALTASAPYMGSKGAATAFAVLVRVIEEKKDCKQSDAMLTIALSVLAGRLDPKDAAEVLPDLVKVIEEKQDSNQWNYQLAAALKALATRLDSKVSAAATVRAATALMGAIKGTSDVDNKDPYAPLVLPANLASLAALAPKLSSHDAAPIAATLTQVMQNNKQVDHLIPLAVALEAVAARLDPKDAAGAAAQIVATILRAIKDTKNAFQLESLAQGLAKVAVRLDPKDAAAATASAVAVLTDAIKNTEDPLALLWLARGLSALVPHLDPEDAARSRAALTEAMNRASSHSTWRKVEPEHLFLLDTYLDAKVTASIAALIVADLIEEMTTKPRNYLPSLQTYQLRAFLTAAAPPPELRSRCGALSSAVCSVGVCGHPLGGLALLTPAAEPLACRLSTQQLVDLLKLPTCIGAARRVLLDQLGNRYQRAFADMWEFVRFAKEQKLDLDFTTPPQRPEPAAPAR